MNDEEIFKCNRAGKHIQCKSCFHAISHEEWIHCKDFSCAHDNSAICERIGFKGDKK